MSETKNYYEHITEVVNEDGEMEMLSRVVKRKVSRDKFIMLYLKDIRGILGLSSKAEFKVLLAICEISGYNTNEVILIKPIKEKIATITDLSYGGVSNAISNLRKKDILIRSASSTYVLNPKYFFKGEDRERANVIRLTYEYQIND
jgi:hypothetical protein